MGTLQHGHRLINRAGEIRWCHTSELRAGDVDLTELDPATFDAHVREHVPGVLLVQAGQEQRA